MNDPPFNLRQIALPAFGPSFLFALGEGAILPVIALTVRQLGGSVALAALMVTLIGIGSLVSNIPASLITARWGERWAIVGAALWGALGMALCVLATGIALFAIGVTMVGMSAAVFGLARQSYLTEAVPFHFRARALSTLGGVMRIGLFVGPFLAAAVIHAVGIAGAYWAGVGSLVVSAIVAVRMPDLPAHATVDTPAVGTAPLRATFRSVGLGHAKIFLTVGVGALLVSAVRASRQAVIPLWAEGIGLDAATTSLIYGLAGGIDMLVFYPAGKVMDRKGRAWVAVPSMLIMGIALMLTPLTHGWISLLLVSLVIGFGNGIGSGMIMTLGADYSPVAGRAHFLGLWRLMSDIGSTGGPALLSAITAMVSLAAGIWCTGAIGFAAAWVLWHWIPRTARHPAR
ncbi:MAG TPA: MFS transporter [Caldimonas sp.]|nr:MFS transporter [Caldimonas sp.]HEX4233885.1 MFS transporter [Caldimonas sp.]